MARSTLALLVTLAGCGPSIAGDDGDTGGDDGSLDSTSESGADTHTDPTGSPSTSMQSTSGDPDDGEAEVDGSEIGGDFITGGPDGGGPDMCSIWDDDTCPEGWKCMPYANDGGHAWNDVKCTPIVDAPQQIGDPCTAFEGPVGGVDDCDAHMMCWDVDPGTNEGTCIGMCIGSEANPTCADDESQCMLTGAGVLALCLPICHPLTEPCEGTDVCVPVPSGTFHCAEGVGDPLVAGEACEFVNECEEGLVCASGRWVAGCEGSGCCAPFCDLLGETPCPGTPEAECFPWYEDGQAPPGFETLGVCAVTP